MLIANLNALVFDYIAKQKVPGTNINYFMIEQLPILPPTAITLKQLRFPSNRE